MLNVPRNATYRDIARSYRNLARIHHPDKYLDYEEKKEAEARFLEITTAYDVLKEEESRKDYDFMLDNPDEMYRHYWRYYRRKVIVDVRIVLIVTISIISVFQYYGALSKYNEVISYFLTVPKYRFVSIAKAFLQLSFVKRFLNCLQLIRSLFSHHHALLNRIKAQEIAKTEGLLQSSNPALKRKNRAKSKDQIKREEELILRKIIEERMNIMGSCSKPTIYDILWVQLVFLPYTLYKWAAFYLTWYYKFNVCKLEYGDEEKLYIIRKNLKLSEGEFNQLEEEDKEYYLSLQLWKKDKFDQWKKEEDERNKAKLAESSQHKRYRRWMKKGEFVDFRIFDPFHRL